MKNPYGEEVKINFTLIATLTVFLVIGSLMSFHITKSSLEYAGAKRLDCQMSRTPQDETIEEMYLRHQKQDMKIREIKVTWKNIFKKIDRLERRQHD